MKLYPYQAQDVERMEGQPHFLNANEPGTGKTFEAISDAIQAQANRILVVCPNSVKGTWEAAASEHMPWLYQMTLNGTTRDKLSDYHDGFCIVNWEALRLIPALADIAWDFVIADEAHAAKNRKAKQTRALKAIKKVKHKRALTGTPIVNNPSDLWSILNWLDPKTWRGYWKFFDRYVASVDSGYGYKVITGSKNEDELWERITPFTCRRMKRDVLPDLPDKYMTFMPIEMHPKQVRAYAEMKKDSLAWLDQLPSEQPLPAMSVLAQLTRLRQFASAYCEITAQWNQPDADPMWDIKEAIDAMTEHRAVSHVKMTEPSTKLDALEDIMAGANGPIVVFSQFTQLIELAAERLKGYRVAVLTGKTPQGARAGIVRGFQDREYDVFLANIQAGGVGIDLFAASTCVFLDRAWSPAMNTQAEDRLHRNGQQNAVQVIVMQSRGTVDLYIEKKLIWKADIVRRIIG